MNFMMIYNIPHEPTKKTVVNSPQQLVIVIHSSN
jgi:hypothetical protein